MKPRSKPLLLFKDLLPGGVEKMSGEKYFLSLRKYIAPRDIGLSGLLRDGSRAFLRVMPIMMLPLFFIPPSARADKVVVIVNKNNPVEEISMKELRRIFKGVQKDWKEGSTIHMYLPPSGSETMDIVLKNVFKYETEEDLYKFYLLTIFQHNLTSVPPNVNNDAEAVHYVGSDFSAIAIVPESVAASQPSVKIVEVEELN
jgi:hypothetical protein